MAKDYVFTLLTSGENKRLRSIIPENDSITSPSTALVAREGTLDSLDEGCCCGTCEAQATSGGDGVTINDYTFPKQQKTLEFRWQAYSIPDKFTVYFCDEEVFSWGSSPDGGRKLLLKPQGCRKVTVKVEGEGGTFWDYTLTCYECLTCQSQPTTRTYSYNDSDPPGKNYGCSGSAFETCANQVINAHIVEKFNRVQLAGRAIKAKVKNGSRIDNEGSIGGVYTVDNFPAALGRIQGDHDITDSLIIEDNNEDDCITAKIPVLLKNSNLGGPIGLAGVTIEWSCCPEDNCICSIPQDLKIEITAQAQDYYYYDKLETPCCPNPCDPAVAAQFGYNFPQNWLRSEYWFLIQASIFNGTFEMERWPEGDKTITPAGGPHRLFGFQRSFGPDDAGCEGYIFRIKVFLFQNKLYIWEPELFFNWYSAERVGNTLSNKTYTVADFHCGSTSIYTGSQDIYAACKTGEVYERIGGPAKSFIDGAYGGIVPDNFTRDVCPPELSTTLSFNPINMLRYRLVSVGGLPANTDPGAPTHLLNISLNLSKKS